MNPLVTVLLAVVGALGGSAGLISILTVRGQRRKIQAETRVVDADAAARLTTAGLALLEPFRTETERLSRKLGEASTQIDALQTEVESLRGQVSTLTKDLAASHDEVRQLRGET